MVRKMDPILFRQPQLSLHQLPPQVAWNARGGRHGYAYRERSECGRLAARLTQRRVPTQEKHR
jgi:hypothetical protein